MKTIEIKCNTEFFQPILHARKLFEVRLNDRDYCEGDILVLSEILGNHLTGRVLSARIGYVLRDFRGCAPNYVAFSLLDVRLRGPRFK